MREVKPRINSSAPQPRNPNHVIITMTMNITSNPIANFLLVHTDGDPGLIPESRILKRSSLLIAFHSWVSASVTATHAACNLKTKLT